MCTWLVIKSQYSNHYYCKLLYEQANPKSHLLVIAVLNSKLCSQRKQQQRLQILLFISANRSFSLCLHGKTHTQLSVAACLATGKPVLTALCCVLSLCGRNRGALFNHKLCFQAPSLLLLFAECVSSPAGPL